MKTRLLFLLAFICAASAQAQVLWNKTYGTATTSQNLNRMIPLANGGYLLVGEQFTGNAISGSTYTIRTNTNGDTIWTRKHQPPGCTAGTIYDAAEDSEGNLILVGAGTQGSTGNYNGFMLKLNPGGDTIWSRKLATPQRDGYFNVIIGNDGTYIVNCLEFGINVIKKIKKNGAMEWGRSLIFSQTDPGFPVNISRTQNGYFVCMSTNSSTEGKMVKLNEAGIELQGIFNFASLIYDIIPKPNNNLFACASGKLFEFNAFGDTLWSKGYKLNNRPLSLTSIKLTPDGNYIVFFDRHNGNDSDVGLMKVTPAGVVLKDTLLLHFGYNEYSRDIAVDANGNYVFAGFSQVSGVKYNIFLAKLRKWNHTLGIKEDREFASGIKLYPNPATEQTTLESEKLLTGTLSLYNLQGKQIWQETLSKTSGKVVPLHNLPAGIYILRFVSENGMQFSRKVIKS